MTTGATGQLGLALPVQGELSGTWGDTVNNGITQYTNIAIAATLTLTNDGAVTLANTTGDASASNIVSTLTGAGTVTAQFAIVRVTGTLTVAKVVTAPSYSKTYTVVNAATGGIVTFKAAGQTGVSIAVGESAFVYFNGTDYVKVSGTSAVSSFSAGTTGFTPNTATTGAVTLAGTLATTNGGTGLTSFTSGGVVYASSSSALATGSALSFDGTSLGIGTSSPATLLTLNGNDPLITLKNAGTNRWQFGLENTSSNRFVFYDNTAAAYRLILDSAGNLGLGVTPSAWGSGTKAFQVGSYGSVNTIGGIDVGIANNAYNDGTNWKYIASQEAAYLKVNRNTFLWNIAAAGTAGNTISFTQAMTLDASGNVQVGTTTGSARMTLAVPSAVSTAKTVLTLTDETQAGVSFLLHTDLVRIVTGGDDALALETNNAERARISAAGNVLIGGTAARGTTVGAAHLDLFNGTAPAGTLTNGVSLYSDSGDLKFMNAAGDAFDVGYRNIPQNSQSAAYTLVLADAGKHIFHPVGDNNARTFTIPANSSVAYPVGTAITFINMAAANVTIAITSDTMYLSSAGTTGSRTLAQYGSATAIKITSTNWLISGSGLT